MQPPTGFSETQAPLTGYFPRDASLTSRTFDLNHLPGDARPPQTFALEQDRDRLTPAALAGLRSLAAAWKLTGQEAADLVGVSGSTWDRMRAGEWRQSMSQDQLMRVSAMVGIFQGLHELFDDAMADRWVRLRNAGPLFANLTPVEAMRERGIPGMIEIRRYVDALRGGL